MNVIRVLDVEFFNEDIRAAVEYAIQVMGSGESAYVVAPGSELVLAARKNRRIMSAVRKAALVLPEGNGVIFSSHVLGIPIKNRICAIDFVSALMARMSEKEMGVFILGKDSQLVEQTDAAISARYPGLRICGSDDGYYSNDDELLEAINHSGADLVIVGYESPLQELWMSRNCPALEKGLMVAVGEGIELLAGTKKPAPKRWRDSGFEWLYWLIKEPWRFARMLKRTELVFTAIWRRLFA